MSVLGRLYRGENDFDFQRAWRYGAAISVLLLATSIGALLTSGLDLGIDFKGGVAWEVPAPGVSVGEARTTMAGLGEGNAKIQIVGENILRVQAGPQTPEEVDSIRETLAALGGAEHGDVSVSVVGPSWGEEITEAAARALVWFLLAIAAYITVRLEWRMAVGALVALVHDIIITVGVYAIFSFEVTPNTVIAFLTILGYSLYDTIVVYDKVHENAARDRGREPYGAIMSRSINQVLMRSLNTTFTSLLPVVSMLVVGAGILGAVTLGDFSIALLVGLLVGAYSSLFVAAPVVTLLHRRDAANLEARARLERQDRASVRAGADSLDAGGDSTPASDEPARPALFSTGHPPRPRKQGKRR